jgi:hypothetical protein
MVLQDENNSAMQAIDRIKFCLFTFEMFLNSSLINSDAKLPFLAEIIIIINERSSGLILYASDAKL